MSRLGLRMTEEQVAEHQKRLQLKAAGRVTHSSDGKNVVNLPPPKPSKYGNRRCVVDGEKFDSEKEARRWRELRLLECAGEIKDLRRQVRFHLIVNHESIAAYVADFAYIKGRRMVVEDVKGFRRGTAHYIFKIKAALMHALHRLKVEEI